MVMDSKIGFSSGFKSTVWAHLYCLGKQSPDEILEVFCMNCFKVDGSKV